MKPIVIRQTTRRTIDILYIALVIQFCQKINKGVAKETLFKRYHLQMISMMCFHTVVNSILINKQH